MPFPTATYNFARATGFPPLVTHPILHVFEAWSNGKTARRIHIMVTAFMAHMNGGSLPVRVQTCCPVILCLGVHTVYYM
jgi:hypothetical protein